MNIYNLEFSQSFLKLGKPGDNSWMILYQGSFLTAVKLSSRVASIWGDYTTCFQAVSVVIEWGLQLTPCSLYYHIQHSTGFLQSESFMKESVPKTEAVVYF
jgi:hypothetical protein